MGGIRAYIRESVKTQRRLVLLSKSPGGRDVLEYVNEFRVTFELAFTLGSLWWTIRIIGSTATIKDPHYAAEQSEKSR